jgi:hypothetical protein
MAIDQGERGCVYELRIPFSELGTSGGLGARIGLAIQLNDNDGQGVVARINWGEGLQPQWQPSRFGMVTLVE